MTSSVAIDSYDLQPSLFVALGLISVPIPGLSGQLGP